MKDELEGVATSPREGLTDDDFNNMFTGIRSLRYERVKGLQNEAKQMASVFSLKGFLTQYIAPLVIIVMGQQGQLGKFATNWVGGVILKHLPKPKRRHAIPWNDELPAQPIKSVSGERVIKFLATSTLLISFYAANASLHTKHSAPYDSFSGRRPVIDTFTGIKGVDNTLAFLASFFSYSVVQSAQDPFPRLQLINLLSSLAPIYTIWTIEASRRNSRFSPITLYVAIKPLLTSGYTMTDSMQTCYLYRTCPTLHTW